MYMEVMYSNLNFPLLCGLNCERELVILTVLVNCLFSGLSDGFPPMVVGNGIGNIPNSQLVQYESAACIVDNGGKYEGFYESYLKIDGGGARHSVEKTQVSFNDKNQPKQSAVIMLSYKRKSVDNPERTSCMYPT